MAIFLNVVKFRYKLLDVNRNKIKFAYSIGKSCYSTGLT